MKSSRESPAKRHASWSSDQIRLLIENGMINFIPVDSPGPETIGERRAILPLREYKGELIPHLELKSPEAKRFLQKARDAQSKAGPGEHLKQRSQVSCLCQWAGIPESLWHTTLWWECLSLRYLREKVRAVDLLPSQLRSLTEQRAEEFRQTREAPDNYLQEIESLVQWTLPSALSKVPYEVIASEYLRALASNTWGPEHRLQRPFLESGIAEQIVEIWEPDQYGPIAWGVPPTQEIFARFLLCRNSDQDALIGHTLCRTHLKAQRIMMDAPFEVSISPVHFNWLSERYEKMLGVPKEVMKDMYLVRRILAVEDHALAREAARRVVFIAASVVENEEAGTYAAYLDWIRFLQAKIRGLPPSATRKAGIVAPANGLLRLLGRTLMHEVLLNCVFHNEVLAGWDRMARGRSHGGQSSRIDGVSAAFVVKRLREFLPERPTTTVEQVLEGCPPEITTLLPPMLTPNRRGIYDHAVPIMNAFRFGKYPFNAASVRGAFKRYENRAELLRFDADLGREFDETQRWMQRMANLP